MFAGNGLDELSSNLETLIMDQFAKGAITLQVKRNRRRKTTNEIECQYDIDIQKRETMGTGLAKRKKMRAGEKNVFGITMSSTVGAVGRRVLDWVIQMHTRKAKGLT